MYISENDKNDFNRTLISKNQLDKEGNPYSSYIFPITIAIPVIGIGLCFTVAVCKHVRGDKKALHDFKNDCLKMQDAFYLTALSDFCSNLVSSFWWKNDKSKNNEEKISNTQDKEEYTNNVSNELNVSAAGNTECVTVV